MCYFLSFFKGAGTPRKSDSDVGLAENGFAVKPWPKLEPKALVKKHFLVSRLVHMFVIDIYIYIHLVPVILVRYKTSWDKKTGVHIYNVVL